MAASAPSPPSTIKTLRDRLICLAIGVAWLALIGAVGAAGLVFVQAKRDLHFTQKMHMRVVLSECLRAKTNATAGLPRAEITTRCARLVQSIQERVGLAR